MYEENWSEKQWSRSLPGQWLPGLRVQIQPQDIPSQAQASVQSTRIRLLQIRILHLITSPHIIIYVIFHILFTSLSPKLR